MVNEAIFNQLYNSLLDLETRNGKLTYNDISAEVINNACLDILRERRKKNLNNVFEEAIISAYLTSANKIIPSFDEKYLTIANHGIRSNLEWSGMWYFLKQYFEEKHSVYIDKVNEIKKFISTKHTRFENEILIGVYNDLREVVIEYLSLHEIIISIKPNVGPKRAKFTSSVSGIKMYTCEDDDYSFHIYNENNIEKIVALRNGGQLKIIYER